MSKLIDQLRGRWFAYYRASPLEQFIVWWKAELRALAPDSWRAWFDYRAEYLLVVADGEDWLLYRAGGDAPGQLARINSLQDAGTTQARLPRLLAEFEHDEPRRVFALGRDTVLIKRLTLPAATGENLPQVLGFEMDRHTPFKADQVYFDYRILARDPKARTITVEVVVTPKVAIDELLAAFKARGMQLDALDVVAERHIDPNRPPALLGVNLLPQALRPPRAHTQLKLNAGLAGAAGILLLLAMWQAMAMRNARIQMLESQVEAARGSAMEVAALRKDLEQAVEAANFLMQEKREQPVLVNVLQEATRILPDHSWLQRLQIEEQQVTMLGETPSAAEIIGLIDASPLFNEPRFVSPITSNANSNTERFNIAARVAPGVSPFGEGALAAPAGGGPAAQSAQAENRQGEGAPAGGSPAEQNVRAENRQGELAPTGAGQRAQAAAAQGGAAAQNPFSNLNQVSGNGPAAPRS